MIETFRIETFRQIALTERMKMKRVLKLAMIATCSIAVTAIAGAQNLVLDPGFETAPAGAADWTGFGNASWSNTSTNPTAHTGTGMIKEFGTFPGTSGYFQNLAASAGQTFTGSAWGLNASNDAMQVNNAGFLRITFFNIGGTELAGGQNSNTINSTTTQDVWQQLTISSVTAPVGTDHAQVFCLFTQPGTNGGSARFDDVNVSLVTTPEPVSMCALGAGLLCLVRRRRK